LTMAKAPAFQFYANDFMDATRFWDANAVGLYIRCMCIQWTQGAIPADLKVLARGLGCDLAELEGAWPTLSEKFVDIGGGMLQNQRLEASRVKVGGISAKRSEAANVRWSKDASVDANAYAKKMQRKMKIEDEVEDVIEDVIEVEDTSKRARTFEPEVWPTFNDWWGVYDKKVDRAKCEKMWLKLSQAEKEKAYRHTEAYVPATPDVQFRRNPATYLNNKNWDDEQLTIPRQPTGQVRPEQLSVAEKARLAIQANAEFHASQRDAGPSYWDQ
jgi:uncharacterized protein YdaU (DUF1376 family)